MTIRFWARASAYLPRKAAGGGPSAERSEERMVEGASGRLDSVRITDVGEKRL